MSSPSIDINLLLKRTDFTLSAELHLPARGITVLFGPSGSGKTSVLRCLAGLERAQGQIKIDAQVWQDSERGVFVPAWQRDLGYVFQEASLFAHLSVQQNLQYGVNRTKKPEAAQALSEAIDLLGISHLLNRGTTSLSGGERQRVAIARALAMQPRLLLLDEPLASLDQARREEILPWLERMHTSLQIPLVYVTHSMQELTRLADYVVLMQAGRVKLHGPVTQALADPNFAAAVGTNAGAILHGKVIKHDDEFCLSAIDVCGTALWVRHKDLPIGHEVRLHIHASDVSLATRQPVDSSIQNVLQGVIDSIHDDAHPANCLVRLRCGDQQVLARITRKARQVLGLNVGASVWAQVKSVALTER